jgi:hypothetical protein
MVVVVTYIKLRNVWGFFRLSYQGLKITLQARKQKGFVKMSNTGWGKEHYTLSGWEHPEAVKEFVQSGAHLASMRMSARLSTEIRTYMYEAEQLPDWNTAKALVKEKGRAYTYP